MKVVNSFAMMTFVATNGVMVNIADANWFVAGLSWISPARYNCEGFVRRMLGNWPQSPLHIERAGYNVTLPVDAGALYERLGYTLGDQTCILVLLGWAIFAVLLCILAVNLKFRKL